MFPSLRLGENFTTEQWQNLNLAQESPPDSWLTAREYFDGRFNSRYFFPLSDLPENNAKTAFGFIVLGTAFLLLETLEGFKRGLTNHTGQSKNLFKAALAGKEMSNEKDEIEHISAEKAEEIYKNGRCALLHSASTDLIRIRISGPTIKIHTNGTIEINRNAFFDMVKNDFREYGDKLSDPGEIDIRKNFITKMNHIAGIT